jgi:CHAD domain-containing protein
MGGVSTMIRETERKYETNDAEPLPDPGKLLGLRAGSPPQEQQLEAVYFDTPDLRLLRARVTLRRREGGHDEGWHVKLPAGNDSRNEIQLPLTRDHRTPPPELVSLTRLTTRGGELAPVAQLNTHRRRWVLTDPRGRALAELVEDEVSGHTMGSETRATSWREIEVELGEYGEPELLDRIEKKLLKAGARRSASSSKLRRVLAEELPAERGMATAVANAPAGSAGAAVLDYLRAQADTIRANDLQVRRDVPDSVHQMRVAARRMRSALQAYGKVIDREATRVLTGELKWLGAELSLARDTEVIAERLDETLAALPDELVLGPVAAQLTRSMQRRRAEGREAALAALDSERYLNLHDSIDQLLLAAPYTARARRPAHRELPAQARRSWRRTTKRMDAARDAPVGAERDAALHEARKAAKRLRYAVEVAEPHVGKPAKRTRRRLKELHSLLGAHQDAVVARPVIRALAVQAHLEGGNGFTYGVLHGLESSRADEAERGIPAAWYRMTRRKTVKWLDG